MKVLPLSLIICFTIPVREKISLNTSIVFEEVMVFITCTSGALCNLWSGVMEWSLGVESWSGVMEWSLGVDFGVE